MNAAPSLPELQRAFCDAVLDANSALAEWITSNGLNPKARLQIYRNIVFNNLSAALRTAFPAVQKLVGQDFFDAAAARYIGGYPSQSGNLQDYGAHFPVFLTHMPEAASLAYLPDVARLEWARQQSYLAADAALPDSRVFAQMFENQPLKLSLHPSVQLVTSSHPIWDIWMFCQKSEPERLDLSSKGQSVLIWRDAPQLAMQPLESDQQEFLVMLLAGETLAVARTRAAASNPGFDAIACLQWLMHNGLIIGSSNH